MILSAFHCGVALQNVHGMDKTWSWASGPEAVAWLSVEEKVVVPLSEFFLSGGEEPGLSTYE